MQKPITPQVSEPRPVTIMEAASIARVHLNSIYRLRSKLGAFKREGVWYIPVEALDAYIQRREARAREILSQPSA
jgi:Helix-turn-helix domain